MVELSLWANTAHSLADFNRERLSSKQSLLQALLLQQALQKWRIFPQILK